jgi:site-specific recombinase XerD
MATGKETPSAHITTQTTLLPAIHAWSYFLEDQGCSLHTIKAFTADIRLLAGFLAPDMTLGKIAIHDLNQYLDWMQKKRGVSCSPKTLSRRITSLKSFFRWLFDHGVIDTNIADGIIQFSVMSPLQVVLSDEEVQRLQDAAQAHRRAKKPDARTYTLLKLLLDTGIKKSECLALHPNHIDFDAPGGALLFVRYTNPQYRYKERKIALTTVWVEAYREYTGQYQINERVFPWSQRRLEYLLEDLSHEAGLDKHVSFDMCRWTCALLDWKSGLEHEKIRQKLGISKIQWREIKLKLARLAGEEMPAANTEE